MHLAYPVGMGGWGLWHLICAGSFLAFTALGLAAAGPGERKPRSSRRVNAYIGFVMLLSFAAGLSQREAWPFSTWPLIAGRVPTPVSQRRIVAIDGEGREYAVDYRAYLPFEFAELMAWQGARFAGLDPKQKAEASAYLLSRVERARRQWRSGSTPQLGPLGPFSTPYFLGHPAIWSDPERLPGKPLVGLRFYEERWDVEARRREPSAFERRLVYEYRAS